MSTNNARAIFVEKTRSSWRGQCWVTKGEAAIRLRDGTIRKYVTRKWFAADEDELTPTQADNYLTEDRGRPDYQEVIYLIISLRGDERSCFAGSDDDLSQVMCAATREVMRELAAGVEARELIWVARSHPDYPNPCVKVLINRDIRRGRSKILKAFPRRLAPRCSEVFLRVFDSANVVGESVR